MSTPKVPTHGALTFDTAASPLTIPVADHARGRILACYSAPVALMIAAPPAVGAVGAGRAALALDAGSSGGASTTRVAPADPATTSATSIAPLAASPAIMSTPESSPVVSETVLTSPPAPSSEAVLQQIELILVAFGKAFEAVQVRQSRDVLHVALTAQQEHLALLMQALADHRHDYGEQLERAVRRLSDELTSDSVAQIGELFHRSASEITGALARTERLSGRLIEKQNHIIDALGTLGDTTARLLAVAVELRDLGGGIAGSLAALAPSRAPAREPERRLQVVASRPDLLDGVREDLDLDDEP